MTGDVYIDFRGYRLRAPFTCMCCGKETSAEQFAYGRTCGICDTGFCQPGNWGHRPEYAHERPAFWARPGSPVDEVMAKYAASVTAEKLPIREPSVSQAPRAAWMDESFRIKKLPESGRNGI